LALEQGLKLGLGDRIRKADDLDVAALGQYIPAAFRHRFREQKLFLIARHRRSPWLIQIGEDYTGRGHLPTLFRHCCPAAGLAVGARGMRSTPTFYRVGRRLPCRRSRVTTTVEVLAQAFKDAGTPFIVGHPGGESVELMEAARQRGM